MGFVPGTLEETVADYKLLSKSILSQATYIPLSEMRPTILYNLLIKDELTQSTYVPL